MKYEIVEFRNKKLGIRKRSFLENIFNYGGEYFDFKSHCEYFWPSKEIHFIDCQIDDIELVFRKHSELTNNLVIKIIK